MAFKDLDRTETEAVLARERVVRIAFDDGNERYLVPVFFTWHQGALCGLTTPGRKTRMAQANSRVAFQVDSTIATGPFEWTSVTGEGTWEFVTDPAVVGAFGPRLQASLTDAPDWAARDLQERLRTQGTVPFRIVPSVLHGRAHGPAAE